MNALRTWFWGGISSPVLVAGLFEWLWEWGGTTIVYAWDICMGLNLRCIWIKWMVDWVWSVHRQTKELNKLTTLYIIAADAQSSGCTLNPDYHNISSSTRSYLKASTCINFVYMYDRPQWNACKMNKHEYLPRWRCRRRQRCGVHHRTIILWMVRNEEAGWMADGDESCGENGGIVWDEMVGRMPAVGDARTRSSTYLAPCTAKHHGRYTTRSYFSDLEFDSHVQNIAKLPPPFWPRYFFVSYS